MKKLAVLLLALVMVLGAFSALAEPEKKVIGFYADNVDSYYAAESDILKKLADRDPEVNWEIDVVTGTGSAAEQLNAVQNFVTAGYDAICVIQNNVQTTSECIALCADAGIPYFGMSHNFVAAPNAKDAAGFIGFNFVDEGYLAGVDACEWGATKVVNVEGVLGQGSAAAQSLGFIQAYVDAGKSIGDFESADDWAATKNSGMAGTDDLSIYWCSGGWMKDSAKTQMANIITELGPDGFDGVYGQNTPMLEGIIEALEEAGLDPSDYWLGGGNGREITWEWVKNGTTDCDVNQSAMLEGDALYQMLKAYFNGEEYRQYIHPYLMALDTDNIEEVYDTLVPFTDVDAYIAKRDADLVVYDINDPLFVDVPGFE